jgi:hypothetical protein
LPEFSGIRQDHSAAIEPRQGRSISLDRVVSMHDIWQADLFSLGTEIEIDGVVFQWILGAEVRMKRSGIHHRKINNARTTPQNLTRIRVKA